MTDEVKSEKRLSPEQVGELRKALYKIAVYLYTIFGFYLARPFLREILKIVDRVTSQIISVMLTIALIFFGLFLFLVQLSKLLGLTYSDDRTENMRNKPFAVLDLIAYYKAGGPMILVFLALIANFVIPLIVYSTGL